MNEDEHPMEACMDGVELDQDEDDFVEEPMAADIDFTNANDPISHDEPISKGFSIFKKHSKL